MSGKSQSLPKITAVKSLMELTKLNLIANYHKRGLWEYEERTAGFVDYSTHVLTKEAWNIILQGLMSISLISKGALAEARKKIEGRNLCSVVESVSSLAEEVDKISLGLNKIIGTWNNMSPKRRSGSKLIKTKLL